MRESHRDPGSSTTESGASPREASGAAWRDELLSAGIAQARRIDALEQAGRELADTNRRLQDGIRESERLAAHAREVERGLREVRERFESAFDNAPIGMALIAMDGHWLQVNDALCRITGHTAPELRATTLAAITHADDVELDALSFRHLLSGQVRSYQVEKRYRHAWGHHVWVLVTMSIVRDEERVPLYVVTQVQDISERKELARHLEYFVDHDLLTGLYNRGKFDRELAKEVDRVARYGSPGAVMVIDLDGFKTVNDTFGHQSGDDVLKGVAGLLRERLRQTDVVARIGGDEFAVLLPQADAEHAQAVAAELVKAMGRQMAVLAERSIRITASVGLTLLGGLTDTEVLAYADLAMYEAKETGRNRFAMYRPAAGERVRGSRRLAEVERIRHALEGDRLVLHAQPILDLKSRTIAAHELLLRLPDGPDAALLPPSAFLYAAERSGLVQAIDGWVVRKACTLIARRARAGVRLALNVNVSGRSIGDGKLVLEVEDILRESGIEPGLLAFELKETAAIAQFEEARAFATRLRGLGCRVLLDDFGAGFGSLSYLKGFPFDGIKLDGELVLGIAASSVNRLVVEAIVGIARGLGKQTIAEFVADDAGMDALQAIGVDRVQGYHVGMPGPLPEVLQDSGA